MNTSLLYPFAFSLMKVYIDRISVCIETSTHLLIGGVRMKNKMIAAVIAASMLMIAACNASEETDESIISESETTTLEETTTTTTEESEEVTEETFTPEQYIGYKPVGEIVTGEEVFIAHDFDLGSNVSLENRVDEESGFSWPEAPNYPAGEDIEISFSCEEELDRCIVAKYNPDELEIDESYVPMIAGNPDYPYVQNIADQCSFNGENDRYTLVIPGEYVESGNMFYIMIGKIETVITESNDMGCTSESHIINQIPFYVRCFE